MSEKKVTMIMDEDVFRKLKVHCAENDTTIKDMVTSLVLRELESKNKPE